MADFTLVMPWWDNECSIRRANFDWIMSRWEHFFGGKANLAVGCSNEFPLERSVQRNELAKRYEDDVIVFADADTVFDPGLVSKSVDKCKSGDLWVIPYGEKRYHVLTQSASIRVLSRSPSSEVGEPPRSDCEAQVTSWAGCVVVPRVAWESVGGYDERFTGWGHEDVAFRLALDYQWRKHDRIHGGYVMHLWHPRNEADFGSADELRNRKLFEQEYVKKFKWRDERLRK